MSVWQRLRSVFTPDRPSEAARQRQKFDRLRATGDVDGLIDAFLHWEHIGHSEAAEALGDLGDARAVEPLVQVLVTSNSILAQEPAAAALGRLGDQRAVGPLLQVASDEGGDRQVRVAAAASLRALGHPEWAERLAPDVVAAVANLTAGEQDRSEVRTLVDGLAALGAVEALVTILKGDNWWARARAAGALGSLGDEAAVPALIETLHTSSDIVRQEAIGSLAQIGDARAVGPLIEALDDQTDIMYVVSALGALGDGRAVRPLADLLGTEDAREYAHYRSQIIEALEHIGGPEADAALQARREE